MPLTPASPEPSDATETARILRKKSPLLPSDFARLDQEAKKRAFTVTDEVSLDAIRDMRDALAKADISSHIPSCFPQNIHGGRRTLQCGIIVAGRHCAD